VKDSEKGIETSNSGVAEEPRDAIKFVEFAQPEP